MTQHSNNETYNKFDDDKPQEECGIFGIFEHPDAAAIATRAMHSLQHRGQESAGIATLDPKNNFNIERHYGLVGENFTKQSILDNLSGNCAIGHLRYPTSGGKAVQNIQPMFAELSTGGLAIAHNGHLTNKNILKNKLIRNGSIFQSSSDSEVALHLAATADDPLLHQRLLKTFPQLEGSYAIIALCAEGLIGVRDSVGIRPLVLGTLNGSPVLASETCALESIGATFVREIENGEMVLCTKDQIRSFRISPKRAQRLCIFEYIYFARPDSILEGRSVYNARKRMGEQLAIESDMSIHSDVIVPVPESGIPAALGYASQANIPFEFGIIRNPYVGRTFIEPSTSIREFGVKLKHSANKAVLKGKSVTLIDDSIVRGTTSKKIVDLVRSAGAKYVHMRISCPPIKFPDYYGIDTPTKEQLIANLYSLKEMQKILGLDSLNFLSLDGLYLAICKQKRCHNSPQFTDHSLTGEYPTKLSDLAIDNIND